MNPIAEISRLFEEQVVDACDRIFTQGVATMRKDIESAGLVLSEELKKSLYSERTFVSDQLEAQFRMGMRGYGRFKDIKKLNIANFPNVDALREFVEEIGIDKFINNETVQLSNGQSVQLYVPGYHIDARRKVAITESRAKNRIVFGIGLARKNMATLRRSKKPFYNVNKSDIYYDIVKYLMTKLPADMLDAMKRYYETPFYDRES